MDLSRIAVAAHCFPGPLRLSLPVMARSGARGVQFDGRNELKAQEFSETGRRQLLHDLDEHGLSIASLTFPAQRPLCDPRDLEARVEAIKRTMEFSAQLRARIVTVRPGRIPDDPASDAFALLRDVLNDLCRFGNHVGATLAIIPTFDTAVALRRIIAEVTQGPIGVHFDTAICVMSGQSIGETMRALHDLLVQIQVRDAIRDVDGGGQEVAVGRGEVEWDEFVALLDETAFRGWLAVDRTRGDDLPGDVSRAVQYLREVSRG